MVGRGVAQADEDDEQAPHRQAAGGEAGKILGRAEAGVFELVGDQPGDEPDEEGAEAGAVGDRAEAGRGDQREAVEQ